MRAWKRWAHGALTAVLLAGCSKGGMDVVEEPDMSGRSDQPDLRMPPASDSDLGGVDQGGSADLRTVPGPDLSPAADMAQPPSGDAVWQRGAGGPQDDQATSIVSDRSGNVYVTGQFKGSLDLGGGALVSAGLSDIFLVKYDPTGKHVFSARFGSNQEDRGARVAIDSSGNVVLLATIEGAVDFGGGPLNSAGDSDPVVAKFSPSGSHLWSRRLGGALSDTATGLALDKDDSVFATGIFSGMVDFGTGPLTAYSGFDGYLVKLSADGTTTKWAKRIGGNGGESLTAVATDAAGNVAITGNFGDTVDFGGGPELAKNRHVDGYLAKYAPDGTFAWVRKMTGYSGSCLSMGVATDSTGNFVVTGYFTDGVDLGSGPLAASGTSYDTFLGKYAPDGRPLWSIRGGGGSTDLSNAVAVDAAGNISLVGVFQGSADFGGGLRTAAGMYDVLLAKYNPNGSHIWSRALGGASDEEGLAVAFDPSGNLLLAGSYSGAPDFGGGPLPASTVKNILLLKRAP